MGIDDAQNWYVEFLGKMREGEGKLWFQTQVDSHSLALEGNHLKGRKTLTEIQPAPQVLGVRLSANNLHLHKKKKKTYYYGNRHILNGDQNDHVEVTVDGQETEKITTQLGESQQEAQRPIRSLITQTEGTPQW